MDKLIILRTNFFGKILGLFLLFIGAADFYYNFKILGITPSILMVIGGVVVFIYTYKFSCDGISIPLFFIIRNFDDAKIYSKQDQLVIEIEGGMMIVKGTTIVVPIFILSNYSGLLLFLEKLRNERLDIVLGRNVESDLFSLKAKMKLKEEKKRLKEKTEFL
jgi:hypothetical protein